MKIKIFILFVFVIYQHTIINKSHVFCYQQFFIFIFHKQTQISKIKQTKQQTHTQHLKVQSKGRERGKDNKNTKVTPLNNYVYSKKHCQASMVEGLAPPTRRCTFTETICRRLRIQYASLHMCGVNQF